MFRRETGPQAQGLTSICKFCHTLLTDVSRESPSCDFLTLGADREVPEMPQPMVCHQPGSTHVSTLLISLKSLLIPNSLPPTSLPPTAGAEGLNMESVFPDTETLLFAQTRLTQCLFCSFTVRSRSVCFSSPTHCKCVGLTHRK